MSSHRSPVPSDFRAHRAECRGDVSDASKAIPLALMPVKAIWRVRRKP